MRVPRGILKINFEGLYLKVRFIGTVTKQTDRRVYKSLYDIENYRSYPDQVLQLELKMLDRNIKTGDTLARITHIEQLIKGSVK